MMARQQRLRVSWRAATMATTLLISSTAAAHGGPPQVRSLLASQADSPAVMSLNEGFAVHNGDAWHYVCPALWVEEEPAPAAPLDETSIAIGAPHGLYVMDLAGSVDPHPDSTRGDRIFTFARSGSSLYALRTSPDLTEVLEITADRVVQLWADPRAWDTLAADEGGLQLARIDGSMIERLSLSTAGEPMHSDRAVTPEQLVSLQSTVVGGELYVLARTFSVVLLGHVEQGTWTTLCTADDTLSGPVQSDGRMFVSVDGTLRTLDDGCAEPLTTPEIVVQVSVENGRGYASTERGLYMFDRAGLGGLLFELRDLKPPPPITALPVATQTMCCEQWQRYQQDFFAHGLIERTVDCGIGGAAPAAERGTQNGPQLAGRDDAGAPGRGLDRGCSVSAADLGWPAWLAMVLLGVVLWRRR